MRSFNAFAFSLLALMAIRADSEAQTPAPARIDTSEEVADALGRLGPLRDQGLITPEEYAAKRQELLDRL